MDRSPAPPCATLYPHRDYYSGGHIGFKSTGTPIRTDPYFNCGLKATAHAGDSINVWCGKINDNQVLWFYVESNGVQGWARWDDLHYSIPYVDVYGDEQDGVEGRRCGGSGNWGVWKDNGVLMYGWGPGTPSSP